MASHRFLFYDADTSGDSATVTLTGGEHHHVTHALRRSPGDTVFVTNGRGLIVECRIEAVSRAMTVAEVLSVVEDEPPRRELVLALGAIKKDRFEQALEQCVQLGITRCLPFVSANASYRTYSPRFLSRLRKIALSAVKQSFRSFLPSVDDPVSFGELVAAASRMDRVVVGRRGAPPARPQGEEDTLIVVGPEAGLTEWEAGELEGAGAEAVGVSAHRLRSETAAVALVAALWRGD